MKKINKILLSSLAIAGLVLSTGIGQQTVRAATPNLTKENTVTISHKTLFIIIAKAPESTPSAEL